MGCSCVLTYLEKDVEVGRIKKIIQIIKTNPKLLRLITFFQSVFRGYIFRKKFFNKKLLPQGFYFYDTTIQFKSHSKILITKKELFYLESLYPPLNDDIPTILLNNIEYKNKSEYLGEWNINTGKRHGRGIQKWLDGSKYEGYFVEDKAGIHGKLTHSNKDVYEGEWANDKAEGFGIYTRVDGSKYEGYWKNDKQNGRGIETWPDGTSFEGNYRDGMKNGFGKFKWRDGSTYQGGFFDNKIQGKGTYIWSDKRKYSGMWRNNEMNGHGTFIWPDGRKYEGEYKKDKKEGYGIFYWPDGKIYKGEWKNGKQHGVGEVLDEKNKKWKKGYWEEGNRINWIDSPSNTININ